MNAVLSSILSTGSVQNGSDTLPLHSGIDRTEGEFLQGLLRRLSPTVSVEIGLAYGISALFICDALEQRSGTQHIVIDPGQTRYWHGIGVSNLRRAGYGDIVRLIEEPSCVALPELERSGQKIEFAFVDGSHYFDFAFVDFFFIDRLLPVGGIVALDDAGSPTIRKLCRFVRMNLPYYSVAGVCGQDGEGWKHRAAERLLSHGRIRRLLRSDIAVPNSRLGLKGGCIAFRKEEGSRDSALGWENFRDF
jgi:hypothetical protein